MATRWIAMMLVSGLVALTPAVAADFARIGPQASAADLLAARPATHEPALEFVYKVEGSDTAMMTVDLAADFIVVRRNDAVVVYDYALRRVISIDVAGKKFSNSSLYAQVDFRLAETYNRRMLHAVLEKAGAADAAAMQGPFWTQTEIHVMDPRDGVPDIRRSEDANGVHFAYDGKEVAAYTPSPQALTVAQAVMFAKFLNDNAPIHPIVIRDIVTAVHLPQRLSFAGLPLRKGKGSVWTLQSVTSADAAYPLPLDARPAPDGAKAVPLDGLLPLMLSAVAGRAPGRRSIADYHVAVEASLNAGKPFEAALRILELSLQYGNAAADCPSAESCHTMKQVFAAARSDPRMAVLASALDAAEADRPAAVDALKAMQRDDLDDAYVLDEFLANLLVMSDHGNEALPFFAAAIKANPYIGGYYKDLGDYYRYTFEPESAWLCYDLGRALPDGGTAPVISGMSQYEDSIAAKFPEFF